MKQYIFILGVGNVGREFIKRVIDKDSKKITPILLKYLVLLDLNL